MTKDEAIRTVYIHLDDVPNFHTDEEHFTGWADMNDPGTWIQPMRFDADVDEFTSHWLLCRLNGETPEKPLKGMYQVQQALMQLSSWEKDFEGVLDSGLEAVFDCLEGEKSTKADRALQVRDSLESEAARLRERARLVANRAQSREKAAERLTDMVSTFLRINGEARTKDGKTSFGLDTDAGRISCSRIKDGIKWPAGFKAEGKINLTGDYKMQSYDDQDCLVIIVQAGKLPLSPDLLKMKLEVTPDTDAVLESIQSIPEQSRPERYERYSVRKPGKAVK